MPRDVPLERPAAAAHPAGGEAATVDLQMRRFATPRYQAGDVLSGRAAVTGEEAREKIGGLLEQQLTMLQGISGLISADQAQAIEHLANAHSMYVEAEDFD